VVKAAKVIQSAPAVIETGTAAPVIEVERPVVVPSQSKIIVKP
jgi:hypothetical protein